MYKYMYTLWEKVLLVFKKIVFILTSLDIFEPLVLQSLWNTQNIYTKFAGLQYSVFSCVLVLHGKFNSFQKL